MCGKSACTVRRGEGPKPIGPSYPYRRASRIASHTELPKSLRTIPTYIVYDNVTQCFGHELLSGAMRFSEEPNDRLHWLRTEGPGTSRLQGNLSGHCRLMALNRSLASNILLDG